MREATGVGIFGADSTDGSDGCLRHEFALFQSGCLAGPAALGRQQLKTTGL